MTSTVINPTISPSKELAPMESFMAKVKAKLRDDIGGLLPDEAVAHMVEKVIADEFFTNSPLCAIRTG
jgi:hypothetical protein